MTTGQNTGSRELHHGRPPTISAAPTGYFWTRDTITDPGELQLQFNTLLQAEVPGIAEWMPSRRATN